MKNKYLLQTLLVLLLLSLQAVAQDEIRRPEGLADVETLQLRIASIEASTTLDAAVAGTLVDLYRRTLTNLDRADSEQATAARYLMAGSSAVGDRQAVLQELDSLESGSGSITTESLDGLSADQLSERVAGQREQLTRSEARLAELRERYTNEVGRPAQIRSRLIEARGELSTATAELAAGPQKVESAEVAEARRWHLQSRSFRLMAEIRKLDDELLSHPARLDLLDSQQQLATSQLGIDGTGLQRLEAALSNRLSLAAEQARVDAEHAQQDFADKSPLIQELAASNVELGGQLTQRINDVQQAADQRDAVRQQVTDLREELASLKNKLAIAGLNQALGHLLVDRQRTIPDTHALQKQIKQREQKAGEVGLEQISLSQQKRDLRNIEEYLERLTAGLPGEQVDGIRTELRRLAESRRELMEQSNQAGSRYLRVLGELDLAQSDLLETVRSFNDFLGKRLLWVRTATPLTLDALRTIPGDSIRLLSPGDWAGHASSVGRALVAKPSNFIVLMLLFVAAFLRNRILALANAGSRFSGRIRQDQFRGSLQALALTTLAAIAWPLMLVLVGFMTASASAVTPFSNAVGSTLVSVGANLLVIQFFIDTCRPRGLVVRHCGWPEASAAKLSGELRWFRIAFPLAQAVGKFSLLLDGAGPTGGLAVLGLLVAAGSLALLVYRLLTPEGGLLGHRLSQSTGDQPASNWRMLLSYASVAVMPVLMITWLAGYTYMGQIVADIFLKSLWLVLWLMLLHGLLAHWLMINFQQLEFKAAFDRRQAARRAQMAEDDAATDPEIEEETVDFAELNSDGRNLLATIILLITLFWLWLIWAPIVPALESFVDATLWTRAGLENGEAVRVPVTIMDLLIAFIIAIVTGAAARGLPSLAELFMLKRKWLTAGERYTVTTLSRYLIIGIGAVVVINRLGVDWSKVQWLVAALGVGIGFGLQEIVANFISGLIILFERPIRVGDTVTVGDTSGVVTRIRIRATTIRDWDRRELLVPNREFISNRLLNWSLSDDIIRLLLPIGISYNADVGLAMKLVEEAAREHESILDEPPPFVVFEGFGDNALQISLRAFIGSIDDRVTVTSELNVAIEQKFRHGGVTIAYPQRDIHLDTARPLEVRMVQGDAEESPWADKPPGWELEEP